MTTNKIQKVLIVFAHPNPTTSLNAAILQQFQEGLSTLSLEVQVRDLYDIGFQPVLNEEERIDSFYGKVPKECEKEQEYLLWADAIVWLYPAWNFSMPAILKGYLDKVFMIPGFSFATDETGVSYAGGLFQHKKSLIIQTLGSHLQSGFQFGNATQYVQGLVSSLAYTGIKNVHVTQYWNLYEQTSEESENIKKILEHAKKLGENFLEDTQSNVQIISTESW